MTTEPTLRVTPQGRLHLDGADDAPRLAAAFARGAGDGILHLAAVETDAALSPGLAWARALGASWIACARAGTSARPVEELARLAASVPPLDGAEYVDAALCASLWDAVDEAGRAAVARHGGRLDAWLHAANAAWNLVGRVAFHLAENRRDPELPFAFLATYTVGDRHRPLAHALDEHAGDKAALLRLLEPVHRAGEASPFVRALVESGDVFHPLAWTADEAYTFLREAPACEAAGVVVRLPDWWKARPRVRVAVTVGQKPPSTLGLEALVDFRVGVSLDGETLGEREWRALLDAAHGESQLALLRGRWVEVDGDKLREVLGHFRDVARRAARGELSLLDGMRLLAGTHIGDDPVVGDEAREVTDVRAGDWLAQALAKMRAEGTGDAPPPSLRATLRPYQRVGFAWLHFLARLGLGACLADDMGLGKTVQVLALLARLRDGKPDRPSLLVVPVSLIANWQAEAARFTPELRLFVAHASVSREKLADLDVARLADFDLVVTTYGNLWKLPWLARVDWNLVILDEAQAIKNAGARQTCAAKSLRARARVALSGTPVENRTSDIYSLFDFLNPGLLGSAREFAAFTKKLSSEKGPGWGPLRELVRPYVLRRLKTDRAVVADLPDKTEVKVHCGLSRRQAALYQDAVETLARQLRAAEGMQRRGLILSALMRFKQICNHPSHALGDGAWDPGASGKAARLGELVETVAARQEKALVFTQFREMCAPLDAWLAAPSMFARKGLVLHGGTTAPQRKKIVDRFQSDDDVPYLVVSVKAGGVGLNLTAASHVVHFDRWWNPAVEDQATDRAFRIGQTKNVLVHKMVCRGTVEERIDALIEGKRGLARDLLGAKDSMAAETLVTEMRDEELLALVSLDLRRAAVEG